MASSHGWPLRTKSSAATLPEGAITVQRTWSSTAFVGGLLEGKGCKEPSGAATWPRAGNGTFCSFSQSCAHTSSSLRGSWKSTAACSSSVSSQSDRLSYVGKVAARSQESTWQKNLNQDTHVWHNRAHASKRYDKNHAGTFYRMSVARGAGRANLVIAIHCVEEPWCGIGHSQQTMFNECKCLFSFDECK